MTGGRFITLEGGEGSGKTTQISLLLKSFTRAGVQAIKTREPGGTAAAEKIRDLLVRTDGENWDAVSETLLFYAARREHVVKHILPHLARNITVTSDRFADSTRVYQGFGKELGDAFVMALHRLALGNFMPDLTFWLDVDAAYGLKRAQARQDDKEARFENMALSFHERVHGGFEALTKAEQGRIVRVDTAHGIMATHRAMIHEINQRFGLALGTVS